MESECWRKVKKIGSGPFGSVFLACKDSSPMMVAVKSVECSIVGPIVTSLIREREFLSQLIGTPNVVRLFGEDVSVEKDGKLVHSLFFEYASGGSLGDMMWKMNDEMRMFGETLSACYASMLLKGLVAIHSKGICHCDLTPANVLVFPDAGISLLKIAGFGSARGVSEEEQIRPADESGTYNRTTLLYASPESVLWGLHGKYTDIWSLGCIVFEMLTGKPVWNCYRDEHELIDQILKGKVELPAYISDEGADFLTKCLEGNLLRRSSAADLLDHPFIVNNLEIMSQLLDIDFNQNAHQFHQENPLGGGGTSSGLVSKRRLFSKSIAEDSTV